MKRLKFISVIVCILFGFGLVSADDPVITDVEVARPVEDGITTNTHAASGMKVTTVLNGAPVMFQRVVATTLAWTAETSNDETNEYMNVIAPQAGSYGNKTCCKFICDNGYNYYLDMSTTDCRVGGTGCQVCTLLCTGGWVNCPAGTKLVAN